MIASCSIARTPAQQALWERLEHWSPDGAATGEPFTHKLAREQGWSRRRAERVLVEYRRFLFLAVSAGHGVCPSEAVDRAWHQHLLDTRPYWEEFCPQVLGMALHHSPSRGSAAERQRLESWYAQTLASYGRSFGEAPPADLWPAPARRFPHSDRAGEGGGWRIGRLRLQKRLAGLTGLAGLAVLLTGCGLPRGAWSPFALPGEAFLGLYLGLMVVAMLVGDAVARWAAADPQPGQPLPPADALSPREMAYLVGGERQVALLTLVHLRERGDLDQAWALSDPIERDLSLAVQAGRPQLADWPGHTSAQRLDDLKQRLSQLGLLVEERRQRRARRAVLTATIPVLVLGVLRLAQGWQAGRPIGFLAVLCVIQLLLSVGAAQGMPRLSRRGEAWLARQQQAVHPWTPDAALEPRLMALAVLGVAALPAAEATALAPLLQSLPPEAGGGAAADGGGGCGGGGCGGCGGCGG